VWEAPRITSKICGICPVSHHLAAAKACDNLFRVRISETASILRELMHMGQFIHSHSLHFFFLAAPDFFPLRHGARNVVGLAKKDPELVKKAIKLRKIGQEIIQVIGGKAVHPVTAIPGGMTKNISKREREKIEKNLATAIELGELGLDLIKNIVSENVDLVKGFADIETGWMALVKEGNLELYDGRVKLVDNSGKPLEEFDGPRYLDFIAEHVERWSYLKFPFYKKLGWPGGIYRVGPLARINVCDNISTGRASSELEEFRKLFGRPASPVLLYHYARMIELIYAIERAQELVENEKIIGKEVRSKFKMRSGEGFGVIEAPRGTLLHHYVADKNGRIKSANLIVATVNNNAGINLCITEVAKKYAQELAKEKIGREELAEISNKIEMAIRAYDPCLSCATHAMGQMPLKINIKRI
jgi:coenzyme F420-reducing hydrogenase alpha subunit